MFFTADKATNIEQEVKQKNKYSGWGQDLLSEKSKTKV